MKHASLFSLLILFVVLIFPTTPGLAQDKEKSAESDPAPTATNLPPDPFGGLKPEAKIPDYELKVDRKRGRFSVSQKDGKYTPGDHFAHWSWNAEFKRWGNYYVALKYESFAPKMGVNVKIGEKVVLKSYAPRTSSGDVREDTLILGTAYIEKPGEYPVTLLTGDKSNNSTFQVKGIEFIPAPEGKILGQSIDGTIELHAKTATTFSEMMRYEPKDVKNCLGYWVMEDDWAEWNFEVSNPGKFKVELVQGCGPDNGGSEVAVMVNDQTFKFTVKETGGFQNWETISLGEVELAESDRHKLAIKPLNKAGKAVMDIQKVILTPVGGKIAENE
ncbi:MAG: hypothetical protein HKN23_00895 [Verrucomicrobiales bacterium]|nr:hypothetical protein [Verrucomicrobiales bacterium]